jgi:hypothetical protein
MIFIFQVSIANSNKNYLVMMACLNCQDYFEVDNAVGQLSYVLGSISVPPNTWYHLAYVYNGTNAYIYVNGTLSASSSNFYASSTINATRSSATFGYSTLGYWGSVSLDEIKLYNKALTAAQVQLDMNTLGIPKSGIC